MKHFMQDKKAICGILLCVNVCVLTLLLVFKGINMLNFGENLALNSQNSTQNSALSSQNLNSATQNSALILQSSARDLNFSENSAENSTLTSQNLNSTTQNSAKRPALPLLASVLNFEFAFFISLCIIVLSFLSYKKSILSESKALKPPKIRSAILAQNPPNKSTKIQKFRPANNDFKLKFTHKLTAFFSLAKLVSYALLAVGFLALNAHALLDIAGFICGVSSVLAGCFFYGLWLNHKEKSQNSGQKGC